MTFLKTKNGKKRTEPVSDVLQKEIVPKEKSNQLFNVDYERFCETLRRLSQICHADRQHTFLRHTFASHFMMKGSNIIALQQIPGHASISFDHTDDGIYALSARLSSTRNNVKPVRKKLKPRVSTYRPHPDNFINLMSFHEYFK